MKTSPKSTVTWAIYLGTKMIADGSADSRGACTKPALEAAYKHADSVRPAGHLNMGSQEISGYRISIWGPRGGNLEYMRPI